ncbi:unnamed protein product [Caenorhabditis angaria]|uniref:Domain of unknown function WSN domain-containing protein n=1 Tax=Caenorhabditis angaria TaxID=860376 RepID=A0A9P1IJ06_9PELO|nr:unnamed protein product [Caenorhabditis angaria]
MLLLLPIFLWLQCIVLFSTCSTISNDKEKIVNAAVEAFRAVGKDWEMDLLTLKELGPKTDLLMKNVVPIGAMVVEMAKRPTWRNYEANYEALLNFQNQTEGIRENMQDKIDFSTMMLGDTIPRPNYYKKVRDPIASMKLLSEKYLNPEIVNRIDFINDYKKACTTGERAPESILMYLRYRLIESCGIAITQREAHEISDIRKSLWKITLRLQFDRNHQDLTTEEYILPAEFMDIYKKIDKSILNEDLDVYDRHFKNHQEALEAVFDELRDRASIEKLENYETPCLLRSFINIRNFDYIAVEGFVMELKNQLIDAFIAASCANVSHYEDDESINKYAQKMSDLVTEISSFTSKWLNDSLISAWPSAHNEILNEEILRYAKKRTGYNNDNDMMRFVSTERLSRTGIPGYLYEIIIVRAVDENYELMFERTGDHCSLTMGTSGFDTIIARVFDDPAKKPTPLSITEDGVIRLVGLVKYAEKLNITIQSEMNSLYNAENLPLIAETLKNKIGKRFITQQDFHCWAIVREWSYFPCPTIDYYSKSYQYDDRWNSTTTFSYSKKGPLQHQYCQEFRFFFFM